MNEHPKIDVDADYIARIVREQVYGIFNRILKFIAIITGIAVLVVGLFWFNQSYGINVNITSVNVDPILEIIRENGGVIDHELYDLND